MIKKLSVRFFMHDQTLALKIGAPSHRNYLTAAKAAENYALHSSMLWWDRTKGEVWRNLPTRYDRLHEYQLRLERRVLKLFKAKGMK